MERERQSITTENSTKLSIKISVVFLLPYTGHNTGCKVISMQYIISTMSNDRVIIHWKGQEVVMA
jgi:hypothetical protein